MSTVETAGTAASVGPASGYEVDIAALRSGNDIVLSYQLNGVPESIRFVRVDDTAKLPMDVKDADGKRVVGIDFSGGPASVALQIQSSSGASGEQPGGHDAAHRRRRRRRPPTSRG